MFENYVIGPISRNDWVTMQEIYGAMRFIKDQPDYHLNAQYQETYRKEKRLLKIMYDQYGIPIGGWNE